MDTGLSKKEKEEKRIDEAKNEAPACDKCFCDMMAVGVVKNN